VGPLRVVQCQRKLWLAVAAIPGLSFNDLRLWICVSTFAGFLNEETHQPVASVSAFSSVRTLVNNSDPDSCNRMPRSRNSMLTLVVLACTPEMRLQATQCPEPNQKYQSRDLIVRRAGDCCSSLLDPIILQEDNVIVQDTDENYSCC
jgi:hypothetical protein